MAFRTPLFLVIESFSKMKYFVVILVFCLMSVGCSFDAIAKKQFVDNIKKTQQQVQKTENFFVVEKATPSMLLMLDSFIAQNPEDRFLLLQGAQMHFSYAALFIHDDNSLWAGMHYKQAREYAAKACNFPVHSNAQEFNDKLNLLNANDIEAVFWLAMTWGSWISVNTESIALLDELPQVEALMKKVIAWDEKYQDGVPFMFLGKLNSKNKAAKNYFEKALEVSQRKLLLIHVEYAKTLARFYSDKPLFESLLTEVINTWKNRKEKNLKENFTLVNSVSYNTAKNLLYDIEEFYEEDEDEDDE